jgi:hypothetical protein
MRTLDNVNNFIESKVLPTHFIIKKSAPTCCTSLIIHFPPVVLYGCETWSLTLKEEHRLGEFENRVLRRIFGPKTDEVTGEWRKLHSGELHILYSSPNIIRQIKSRRLRWTGHVARMGEERKSTSH